MAELVGVYAVSHTPVMTNAADSAPAGVRSDAFGQFERVGSEIGALDPDAIVIVSDDHLHNFYLDNLPAFCVGIASQYPSPVEGWLKIAKQILPGDHELGAHILREVMGEGFDPAVSMELTLDHGMMTPLDLAGMAGAHPVVPILVNAVQPPLPSMRRCVALGQALRKAIESYHDGKRIVLLATGGLSHDVGTPRMGQLNEQFDRNFLQELETGERFGAADYATAAVGSAGNGAEEVRNWLIAQGAADFEPFETYYYSPVAPWYTGIGLGRWKVTS